AFPVFLGSLIFFVLTAGPGFGQEDQAPLNRQYVTEVVRKGAIGEDYLIDTIKQRGVDFQLTDALKQQLSSYGASGDLLDAIEQNYKAPESNKSLLMPGLYEGKLGKGDDARRIKMRIRDTGIKLEGSVEYDKAKGTVTNGSMKDGEISVEFTIGKDKGLLTGHYRDGRISGDITYGGKVEKIRLRWILAIQSPQ
ncbi:MAG TPA: hypothetical protein VEZ90_14670, partial [Blastocatellia bacterium]|nr:hypothetical protein [Blastocatellia bacterium]